MEGEAKEEGKGGGFVCVHGRVVDGRVGGIGAETVGQTGSGVPTGTGVGEVGATGVVLSSCFEQMGQRGGGGGFVRML